MTQRGASPHSDDSIEDFDRRALAGTAPARALPGGAPEDVRDATVHGRPPMLQLVVAGLGKSPRDDRTSDGGEGERGIKHGSWHTASLAPDIQISPSSR